MQVYVVSFPIEGEKKRRILTCILLVLVLAIIVVSFGAFIVSKLRSARKEMLLRSALIKQMGATQQAERKSMNKSNAFANASHDIRASLAAISGLIDLCRETAKPESEVAANLEQMSACAVDLLGIYSKQILLHVLHFTCIVLMNDVLFS